MGQSGNRTETEAPATEAEADVDKHHNQTADESPDGVNQVVVGNTHTELVGLEDAELALLIRRTGLKGLDVGATGFIFKVGLGTSIQFIEDVVAHAVAFLVSTVFGGHLQLVAATIGFHLGSLGELLGHGGTDSFRLNRMVIADNIGATTREVNTETQTTESKAGDADDDGNASNDVEHLTLAKEVEVNVAEEVLGEGEGERHLVAVALDGRVDKKTSDEDGSEEGGCDTNAEGDCEALDSTGAEHNQHQTQEECGHLTIDDSGVGVLETVLDSVRHTGTRTEFLLDTLVDNHVTVDSHGHGQHNTCDTGEGEHSTDGSEDAQKKEYISNKGNHGDPAGAVVEEHHVDEHHDECKDERDETVADRLLTQRGTDHGVGHDASGGGKLTGLQHVGKVLSLLDGEVISNLGTTAGDLAVDDGGGIDLVVEHDGDAASHILTCDILPLTSALRLHGHIHLGTFVAHILRSILDATTVEQRGAVFGSHLNGVERHDVSRVGLVAPHKLDFLVFVIIALIGSLSKNLVDDCGISQSGGSDYST